MSTPHSFKALVDAVFNKERVSAPPLVEVQWLDATDISSSWADKDEMDKSVPAPSLAVGYLFHKDKVCVKVIPLVNYDHCANGITIPVGMVKRITYLTRKN